MDAASTLGASVEYCTMCDRVCGRKERTKLAGVKTTLFNPYLASFKTAFHDKTLGKLSDEHSRTTLPPGVASLTTEKYFNYDSPSRFIPKFGIMGMTEIPKTTEEEKLEEEMRKTLENAYQKSNGAFTMPVGRVIQIPHVKHVSYLNYKVRLLTPEPVQKWRQFVYEKNLLFPFGGLNFVQRKFNAAEVSKAATIGHKLAPLTEQAGLVKDSSSTEIEKMQNSQIHEKN